ncbi:FAD-dependent oxidoreductase [Aestuariicoccus sp. MJ-SS9]|uniref:FAD-dependent oxidoreductase n=1 Tax=Aestuariicoccus sp. MJ-SS9 TaxID=3079855 RepID=UPI0029147B4D|nr:FAD-dependent oxidoreductase [Aestuariicoccus sp. MJ-SS9]MDU8910221.1 FAD-dependent oxidoreductase [Aestuariicoccus sp. MJ-SS9]
MAYDYQPFPYVPPPGLRGPEPRHPVAIVGAGPIGLALAIDLAQRGVAAVVLDDNNVVSVGSRAICWAKRTLEIFDRLGVGERMLNKGITWKVGRNFHGADEVYSFDLLPEDGHKYPAFINLQQYYVEEYLIERAQELGIDLRFKNRVVGHEDKGDHVVLTVETPDGSYTLEAAWLCACDGAKSPTRDRMGLPFEGQTFEEHFLIVDVEMAESPFGSDVPERWFWFHPPFHPGQSALLHAQPDNIYRIDLQLGPETDAATEAAEEKVLPRIRAVVGDRPFRLDWMSVYKFRCARLERFVHGRVLFVGDSAHVVSPFGARGGNGGIQDVDNLGWKLAAVLGGAAGPDLLDSYDTERVHAADENILNSTRATNFMTPKSPIEALFREEVLRLSHRHSFARRLVNSGRLSLPAVLPGYDKGDAPVAPGTAMPDAPLSDGWLIERVQGEFTLVGFGDIALPEVPGVRRLGIGQTGAPYPCCTSPGDVAQARYGAGWAYLFRPDGHVQAAFRDPTAELVAAEVARAFGPNAEVTP